VEGKTASKASVAAILAKILHDYWAMEHRTFAGFSDDELYLPSLNEIETFLKENPVKDPGPAGNPPDEGFDCDDYSYVLKGASSIYARREWDVQHSMCLGISWGNFNWRTGFHCCNWVIDADENFHWIEPQDGSLHDASECEYGLTLILA
jgi:hypothetical protein